MDTGPSKDLGKMVSTEMMLRAVGGGLTLTPPMVGPMPSSSLMFERPLKPGPPLAWKSLEKAIS